MSRRGRWSVADAKARLSEVLRQAREAPQVIESRGDEVAIVLSADAYRELESLQREASPPERLARFRSFVNTDEPDPTVVFIRERGQIRPARAEEKAAVK